MAARSLRNNSPQHLAFTAALTALAAIFVALVTTLAITLNTTLAPTLATTPTVTLAAASPVVILRGEEKEVGGGVFR